MNHPTLEQVLELVDALSPEDQLKLFEHVREKFETEGEADARAVREAYGDALHPDGTIDFDKLYAQGGATGVELHQDYPEFFDEAGNIRPEEEWGEDEQ